MLHRLLLTLINIFFPPLAVLLLTGPYTDTLLNCILFLCGVIPSHIHAFYISCTYFHRKKKVRKGRWPGGPKPLIYDPKVWYGGAKKWEADELRAKQEEKREKVGGSAGPLSRAGSKRRSGAGWVERTPSRKGQVGGGGYDRRSQIGDGLDKRRSVMGEGSRQW